MQRDPDVLLTAVTGDGYFLRECLHTFEAGGPLWDDIQFITALINVVCSANVALGFASDIARADRQVILAALSKDPATLRFVRDGGLLGDNEIVLTSLSEASSESEIPLVVYYHFIRNNVDFDLTSVKGEF